MFVLIKVFYVHFISVIAEMGDDILCCAYLKHHSANLLENIFEQVIYLQADNEHKAAEGSAEH